MKGFCQHCGKELNGDEPYCPDCGMPVGTFQPQPTYEQKKNNGTVIAIAIVAIIAVICIVGIAFLPALITPEETYTVTLTAEKFSIEVDDIAHQYDTPLPTHCDVYLQIVCSNGSKTVSDQMHLANHYLVNSGEKTPMSGSSISLEITGDPKDVTFSAFLLIKRDVPGPGGNTIMDYIDIFEVDTTKITSGSSLYYGCSGVSFDLSDFSSDGTVTFTGDSDPIGMIKLSYKSVKN